MTRTRPFLFAILLFVAGTALYAGRQEALAPWSGAPAAPAERPAGPPAPPAGRGPVVRPADARVAAEGRVVAYPGAQVVVGTDFAGTVLRLPVDENAPVRRGQLLAELNADEHRAALAEARARMREAEADIRLAELEVGRAATLFAESIGTRQALDRAERDRDAARARRATAAAEADRLAAVIAKSRVVAPIDGVVVARHAEAGETLDRGARLATIADLARTRIEAEVAEFDAGRVAPGAPVVVRAEGYPGTTWRGQVEEIPGAVVNRALRPLDPGRPSDTRVLLVKIAFAEKTPLKLGQRVEVEIGTGVQP